MSSPDVRRLDLELDRDPYVPQRTCSFKKVSNAEKGENETLGLSDMYSPKRVFSLQLKP